MGRRGPKPEPASVKKAKGNPGRRPIGEDPLPAEQAPLAPSVTPPAWLKDEGLAIWERLAPRVIGLKLLQQVDSDTFARYCRNFARWLKMNKMLDEQGETYESESPHGKYRRAHPAYLISDRLEKRLEAAEASFGLNPAERQRLYAQRAQGNIGDLFGDQKPPERSAPNAHGEKPGPATAIGFLN